MGPSKIKVRLRSDNSTIIEGEWYERIKVDDSTWSVDENSVIFTLEKGNENIWKSVLKGDQEIDATKVDNSKPIDSFDPETQVSQDFSINILIFRTIILLLISNFLINNQ